MHLARTGAFLRALRSARLAPLPRPAAHVACETRFINISQRLYASGAFPEQSVSDAAEVDPKKVASTANQGSEDVKQKEFRDRLSSQADQKIIKDTNSHFAGANISGQPYVFDSTSNVTDSILGLVGRQLYDQPNHPIAITKKLIQSTFPSPTFEHHSVPDPVVSTYDNFDRLGFPQNHPGRSRTDTYYVDSKTVLRTHTSAHQHWAFSKSADKNHAGYTICADVYRRDSIDRSHFPVFHQMEGACVWNLPEGNKHKSKLDQLNERIAQIQESLDRLPGHSLEIEDEAGAFNNQENPIQVVHDPKESILVVAHLKRSLELLVQRVFSEAQASMPGEKQEKLKVRWIQAYFPFTSPSFELEVFWQGEWLELLGCGVVKQEILNNAGLNDRISWAWGIGIERLAMLLFNIPDIRLFWSQDKRFLNQFKDGKVTRFQPYSKYPPCYKDISFWVRASPAAASPIGAESSSGVAAAAGGDATKASPTETQPAAFHENDIMEIVRDVAGTLVEDVRLVDEFVHPQTGKKSLCYRLNYRSNERTLTNEEVNELHARVLEKMADLPIDIRDK